MKKQKDPITCADLATRAELPEAGVGMAMEWEQS